jgi:asparagine synthase (glutamine-hydrolysing)
MASPLAETDELRWQERVLKHLQITDWRRIPIDGELDLIGPFARRHLLRDGLLFPANAHSIVPLLEAAGERCLIVGVGGDELLGPQQWQRVHDLLGRRRGPEHRDLVRLAACVLPRTIRGMARTRSAESFEEMKWLRPATRSRLARAATRGFEEPVLWRAAVRDAAARRGVILPSIAWERLAQASGQKILAPLLDAGFVGALARAGGRCGWGTRAATMNALAGNLLPAEVVGRETKAYFNRVFFAEQSRAFAAAWSGRGLDETLVDPEMLRREWLSDVPDIRTALLLQSAWLTDREVDPSAAGRGFDRMAVTCP